MDPLPGFLHELVVLDAIAVFVALAAGVVVAPVVVLLQGACWWRRRLRWALVALLTSWMGLWLFWRAEASRNPGAYTVREPSS